LKVLDLFCGHGGFSQAFDDVTGIDLIQKPDFKGKFIKADLMDYMPEGEYDLILASPPCTEFSISKKIGWGTQNEMKGLDCVYRAFYIINTLKPKWFAVENVSGLAHFLPPPNYKLHMHNRKRWCLWTNITLGFLPFDLYWSHAKKSQRDKLPIAISLGIKEALTDKAMSKL